MAEIYSSWKFYYDLNITNPSATEGFQASFTVNYLPGMRADFRDVRFADKRGKRLYYFLDSYSAFTSATFFIRLPANDTKMFMYYGNGGVVSESSASSVFDFYDDFTSIDYSIWILRQGSATVSNGTLVLAHNTLNTVFESLQTYPVGSYIEARAYHAVGNEFKIGFRNSVTRLASTWFGPFENNNDHRHTNNGTTETFVDDGVNRGGSTYYTYGVVHLAAGPRFYLNGALRGINTTTLPGSAALPIGFYSEVGSGALGIDWVRVRKYAAIEPTITLGSKHIRNSNGFLWKQDYLYDLVNLRISTSESHKNYLYDSVALNLSTGFISGPPRVFTDTVYLDLSTAETLVNRTELKDFSLISCDISKSIEDTYTQLSAEFADEIVPCEGATVKYLAHDPFEDLENFPLYTADGYPIYTDDGYQAYTTEFIRGYPVYTDDGYQVITDDGFPIYTIDLIHPEKGHLLFFGTTISNTPTLSYLGKTVQMQAADKSRNLTVQKIPWNYQVITLNETYTSWDQWILALLDTEKTGVRAGNIVDSGAPTKQFVFKPKTSRYEAISELAEYMGCIINIKTDSFEEDGQTVRAQCLYVVPAASIDLEHGGFDLPEPIEFEYPDLSIIDKPTVTGEQDEKYNKVIVHGVLSDTGKTTVAAAYTPDVYLGNEKAREYVFEDNTISEKESTSEIEAIKWLLYFTAPRATVPMKFVNRYDLELYQRIRFGDGFQKELRDLTDSTQLSYVVACDPRDEDDSTHTVDVSGVPRPSWMRISDIKYHSAECEETCEIKAITDFIYSSSDPVIQSPYSVYIAPGYFKPVSDDTVSTVQNIVTDTVEKQLTPEFGTVISKNEENRTMVVQTQSGKLVTVKW